MTEEYERRMLRRLHVGVLLLIVGHGNVVAFVCYAGVVGFRYLRAVFKELEE